MSAFVFPPLDYISYFISYQRAKRNGKGAAGKPHESAVPGIAIKNRDFSLTRAPAYENTCENEVKG
jgi:hypothetical protein